MYEYDQLSEIRMRKNARAKTNCCWLIHISIFSVCYKIYKANNLACTYL